MTAGPRAPRFPVHEDMSTAVPPFLLPDTASVDGRDRLSVGDVDLLDLAETFGTPLFVYDEVHVRARCREALAAFGEGVAYSSKAFLCRAMARLAHEEGMHLDVSSGGELYVVVAAGVPPDRIVFHGSNKSTGELTQARTLGVRLVVDSFEELHRLDRLHVQDGITPRVLIRVNPELDTPTHEAVATGHRNSKFGFGLTDGSATRAVERALRSPAVELVGLHAHIGSEISDLRAFQAAVDALAGFFRPLALPELCLGGGLGIRYAGNDEHTSITDWAAVLRHACWAAGTSARVTAEPGRAIVGNAGLTLYRVGTIKKTAVSTFVSVDGGLSDNPRPLLYGSTYEAFLPRATTAERTMAVSVVGKHCETDLLIRDARVPADLTIDDILCVPVTGAYCHAMASNYNRLLRPPVVFVRNGSARVVVRRETPEDLLDTDEVDS